MHTTYTRTRFIAAIATLATPALLLLGAATAQAVGPIDDLPTERDCGSCVGFNPQPDPPAFLNDRNTAGIGNPNDRPSMTTPGASIGLGGPDTAPPQHN